LLKTKVVLFPSWPTVTVPVTGASAFCNAIAVPWGAAIRAAGARPPKPRAKAKMELDLNMDGKVVVITI